MYPDALFEYVASLPCTRDAAWDCATGNGQAAIGLSRHFDRVVATDVNEGQIAHAFPNNKIAYSVQAAEKTTNRDGQFDLVNVAQALHWFDLERFWTEVKRVLKPNGAFVASSYAWSRVDERVDAVIEQHLKHVIAPYWAPNNKLCWSGYQTVAFPFEPLPSPAFEIENHWRVDQYLDYLGTWSATKRCMAHRGPRFFDEVKTKVLKAWGGSHERRSVRMPLVVIAGNAW